MPMFGPRKHPGCLQAIFLPEDCVGNGELALSAEPIVGNGELALSAEPIVGNGELALSAEPIVITVMVS